jgi:hypothetical protein
MQGRIARAVAAVCALSLISIGNEAQARVGTHCAYRLAPISRSGHVIQARLVALGCFATFAEAVAAGTGGTVHLPASATPTSITDADVAQVDPLTNVLIGTEFTHVDYGGISKDYFAADACSPNTYEIPYVGDTWNDTFASGKGFGGCDHNKKYSASNFGGDVITCTPSCSDYTTVRNLVSSLRWKP